MTEDKLHKDNLIKIPKSLMRNNKYADVLPCKDITNLDAYNAALLSDDPVSEENYINASYINRPDRRRAYIATQGPMSHTVSKFWKLIFNKDVKYIVMLCNLTEEIRVRLA